MTDLKKIGSNLYADICKEDLLAILIIRLRNFFIISEEEVQTLEKTHEDVLQRLEICIEGVNNKYFRKDGKLFFSYAHSGQYLIYLYFVSNELVKINIPLMDKVYYLNKILHSVDIYGAIDLPKTFFFEHPLGTVLGRANYGNNFFAMQGCTVGGNKKIYPKIGANVMMFSNSKILGNCNVGDNVWVSANTYIKDQDIPDDTIVFGTSPNLIFKQKK